MVEHNDDYRENLLLHYNKLFNLHECVLEDISTYKLYMFTLETVDEIQNEQYLLRIVQYYNASEPSFFILNLNDNNKLWNNLDDVNYFDLLEIEKIKTIIIRQSDYQMLNMKRGFIYG